jgi:membrane-associated protease RseP (regulator of RpoE activity)
VEEILVTETPGVTDATASLRHAVEDVFEVHDVTMGREPGSPLRLRGRLLTDASHAFDLVAARFQELGYTALFRRERGDQVILAVPGRLSPGQSRLWLAVLLFGLTAFSTLYVGIIFFAGPAADGGLNVVGGLQYALPLMTILLAHELGHYTVARLLGAPVSFPFFIPFPLPPLGTLGAFIQMKAPPRSRRDLLAVAAAGPLAGLVLALPVLLVGLVLWRIEPIQSGPAMLEGKSIMYTILKALVFGGFLPSGSFDVIHHPMALAGWVGLLVTSLNLIPAGQLDGGHIAYALLGRRARWVSLVVVLVLILLGALLWRNWLLWALLISVFGRFQVTPLDDITELDIPGVLLVLLMIVVFALVFTPIPLTQIGVGG